MNDIEMSSPPSSPSCGPIDSSPPSSPSIEPISTPPSSPELVHPFAGSTKATRRPHIYEKRDRQAFAYASSSQSSAESQSHDSAVSSSRTERRVTGPLATLSKATWTSPGKRRKFGRVHSTGSTFSESTWVEDEDGSQDMSFEDTETICLTDEEDLTFVQPQTEEEREQQIWDAAITRAIDKADGVLDLSQHGYLRTPLTSIPSSIADLASLVVLGNNPSNLRAAILPPVPQRSARTFARSVTMPAAVFGSELRGKGKPLSGSPILGKAASFSPLKGCLESAMNGLQILLVNQAVETLPLELFSLNALTVLDLRGNALQIVPPQIVTLPGLCELDLSQNRLRWLPAEMLNMRLVKLSLTGNPWLSPPIVRPARRKPLSRSTSGTFSAHSTLRMSETKLRFVVPPLAELCLRVLLSPVPTGYAKEVTILEALYELPLSGTDRYPVPVLERLRACIPSAVAKPSSTVPSPAKLQRGKRSGDVRSGLAPSGHPEPRTDKDDEETPPGISRCPNPKHHCTVFVDHAEERYTWESAIAGCAIGGTDDVAGGTASVPVRWRGCGLGCLNFLDANTRPSSQEDDWSLQNAPADSLAVHEVPQVARVVQPTTGPLEDSALFG